MAKIIKIILVSFVVLSCQTTEKWIETSTNVEIKVFSERGLNLGNDYLFKWTPPLKYSDRTSNFDIKPDFTIDGKNLYFTPKISENYLISLEVTNLNDSTIYIENFYYNAIDKGIKMKTISENTDNYTINEDVIERTEINNIANQKLEDSKPLDQIISSDNNIRYTIQIVVWKSRKKALEEKDFLNYNGYDAYIEEIKSTNNETIFRVRVGSFEDKKKAEEVRDSILEKYPQWENNKLWITKTE